MLRSFRRFKDLIQDRAGNVAVVFSVSAPLLILAGGGGVDYLRTVTAKASLQALADGAALAGAQSLRLANANSSTVGQAVSGFVASRAGAAGSSIVVAYDLLNYNTLVSVQLTQTVPTVVSSAVGLGPTGVVAKAKARNAGNSLPVCVVGLDPSQSKTISVDVATINASGCQVLSDATPSDSVSISNSAKMNAGRLCSSGGAQTDGTATYSPAPQTSCPPLQDPLATLSAPAGGACTMTNLNIANGSQTLLPGVYCGGLTVTGSANVTLMAGVYVIQGPLTIKAGAALQGTDVTIYLDTNDATLDVDNNASVSLTAPATGPMAGILIFENRAAPLYRNHNFASRSAPTMLGTIYMPRGILNVGVKGGGGSGGVAVGSSSAWTIIVARGLQVADNQTLNLNTNYSATTVPPPGGLGPGFSYGLSTQLVN